MSELKIADVPKGRIESGLSGRVALITGGGQNIGEAIARGFARAGALPIVTDLRKENAEAVAHRLHEEGYAAEAYGLDVSDPAEIQSVVDDVLAKNNAIDILINNAAKFSELTYKDYDQIPIDEWRDVLEVNVTGAYQCILAVTPNMRTSRWGRIVNVSSGTVRMGRPHFLHYVTSKAGLIGMSRSLARELGPYNITVNSLLPGVVFTALQRDRLDEEYQDFILGMQCIPEPLDPEAMVGPTLFLSSEESRFVTGQELAVDGGLTHG